MKSEPETFSIDDLIKKKVATWDGVRNYQVRNMMRDLMNKKDKALFYHSSCEIPGVVGSMEIISLAKSDETFKELIKGKNPWLAVDVKCEKKFSQIITRADLQLITSMMDHPLLKKGNRLSILEISKKQYEDISHYH